MNYYRVLPRDLFNEANLLKCVGKLVLLIEDKIVKGLNYEFIDSFSDEGFKIYQGIDGQINVDNILFYDERGEEVGVFNPLNSRTKWPVIIEYKNETYFPFNEKGEYQLDKKLFL